MVLSTINKFLGALTAAAGVLIANGLLDGNTAKWVTGIIATVGAFVVYLIPNTPPTTTA